MFFPRNRHPPLKNSHRKRTIANHVDEHHFIKNLMESINILNIILWPKITTRGPVCYMMRGESTWFKMFRSRDGIEPGDEGNDLLPSDRSAAVPTEVHWSTFGSFSVYIPWKAEFISIWSSHFSKEMPFFSFSMRPLKTVLLSKHLLSSCSGQVLC